MAWDFKMLLRKHPDDKTGDIFRELIKTCEKELNVLRREYKKTCGTAPKLTRIKKEIEVLSN
jgi:hypothetical protein